MANKPLRLLAEALAPYRALGEKVEQLCNRVAGEYAGALSCRAGCAACCTLAGVLPVEAANLYLAWHSLSARERTRLRRHLAEPAGDDACPLLTDDRCPLYPVRPIICRTHGLPLLVDDPAGPRIDRCPLNFAGYTALPGTAIIHLERLNSALVTVNRQFVARIFPGGGLAERIPLRAFLAVAWPGIDAIPR